MNYLARLKAMIAEQAPQPINPPNTFTVPTAKTDRGAFVGFVGTAGRDFFSKIRPIQEPTELTEGVATSNPTDNSQVHQPQADPNRCHVCGERENVEAPFIAVLTEVPEAHHWLHAGCHDEHIRRCAERRAP